MRCLELFFHGRPLWSWSVFCPVLLPFRLTSLTDEKISAMLLSKMATSPRVDSVKNAIPREDVLELVSSVIKPSPHVKFYSLIVGSHGVGKSTAVRNAAKKIGSGVLYLNIPAGFDESRIASALGDTLGFEFDEGVGFWQAVEAYAFGSRALASSKSFNPRPLVFFSDVFFLDQPKSAKEAFARWKKEFVEGSIKYQKTYGKVCLI